MRQRDFVTVEQTLINLTHNSIVKLLEDKLNGCEAVVCLIRLAYGGEPSARPDGETRRSYTQLEYFVAKRLGKPIFLFVADESTPFDPRDDREPDELLALQRDYRKEATRDRDWRAFANMDQLRYLLAELRFPWERPTPEHKLINIPIASIGKLFKGRDAYLDDLHASLTSPDAPDVAAIVATHAIHGLGGVGKTRAAVEYAWNIRMTIVPCCSCVRIVPAISAPMRTPSHSCARRSTSTDVHTARITPTSPPPSTTWRTCFGLRTDPRTLSRSRGKW
jgi:hypothetical protein